MLRATQRVVSRGTAKALHSVAQKCHCAAHNPVAQIIHSSCKAHVMLHKHRIFPEARESFDFSKRKPHSTLSVGPHDGPVKASGSLGIILGRSGEYRNVTKNGTKRTTRQA